MHASTHGLPHAPYLQTVQVRHRLRTIAYAHTGTQESTWYAGDTEETTAPVYTLPYTHQPETVRGTKIESRTLLPQELCHIRTPIHMHMPIAEERHS